MKYSPLIEKAIQRACVLHKNQLRKADEIPYVSHLYSVAWILSEYTSDEETLVAAFLHDSVEDVPGYTMEKLQEEFGPRVARIVSFVTEQKSLGAWEIRKQKYLEQLPSAPTESLLLCAADKLHNLLSMIETHKVQGDKMWKKFNAPQERRLWYYQSALAILKSKLDSPLVSRVEEALERFKKEVGA